MNTLPDSVYGDDYKHVNIQIVIWRKLENPPKFIKPDISHPFIFLAKNTYLLNTFVHKFCSRNLVYAFPSL